MRVYVLRLAGTRYLACAFEVISNALEVASCTFEPRLHQVRFVAPQCEADALAERIYLDGGLLWCSRHDLEWSSVSDRLSKGSAKATIGCR